MTFEKGQRIRIKRPGSDLVFVIRDVREDEDGSKVTLDVTLERLNRHEDTP